MDGYYYLHTNGDLIFKRYEPESDSDFVKKVWPIDTSNRADAWKIVLESLALNATPNRVKSLVDKWKCDLRDLFQYMVRNQNPSNIEKKGIDIYLEKIAGVDIEKWFDWLASTPKGQKPNWETMP